MSRTTLTAAVAAAALAVGGSVWFAGAGTALAPEPAQLTADLQGSNGATAAAYYVNTEIQTGVVKWPSTYSYNPGLPAGTPCSPYDLGAWATSSRVIQANGNYRKCL